jgi:hypothetical protein
LMIVACAIFTLMGKFFYVKYQKMKTDLEKAATVKPEKAEEKKGKLSPISAVALTVPK